MATPTESRRSLRRSGRIAALVAASQIQQQTAATNSTSELTGDPIGRILSDLNKG